jgi:menaquinone-dependent protoporphyrinogen IX oxidase
MKILVVYYSRTGRTRLLAERLARDLDANTVAITEPRHRQGLFGYQRSVLEAISGRAVPIDPLRRHPGAYDLVLVGTPIWGWNLASPVRAFARQYGRSVRRVAFFCTMGSSGNRPAFDELRRLIGRAPVAELALTEAEMQWTGRADVRVKIRHFVDRLQRPESPALDQAA